MQEILDLVGVHWDSLAREGAVGWPGGDACGVLPAFLKRLCAAAGVSRGRDDTTEQQDRTIEFPDALTTGAVTALCSGHVYRRCFGRPPQHLYAAALLHDILRVVLYALYRTGLREVREHARQHDLSILDAEHALLGITHVEFGTVLLSELNAPETIVKVVKWRHEPDGLSPPCPMVDSVHVADMLVSSIGLGDDADGLSKTFSRDAWSRAGMTETAAARILHDVWSDMNSNSCSDMGGHADAHFAGG